MKKNFIIPFIIFFLLMISIFSVMRFTENPNLKKFFMWAFRVVSFCGVLICVRFGVLSEKFKNKIRQE
jgi:uncharacterized membrane protein YkvI